MRRSLLKVFTSVNGGSETVAAERDRNCIEVMQGTRKTETQVRRFRAWAGPGLYVTGSGLAHGPENLRRDRIKSFVEYFIQHPIFVFLLKS